SIAPHGSREKRRGRSGHETRPDSLAGELCALSESESGLRPEPRRNLKRFHFFGSVFIVSSSMSWQKNRKSVIAHTRRSSADVPDRPASSRRPLASALANPPFAGSLTASDGASRGAGFRLSWSAPRSVAALLRRAAESSV